MSKNQKAAAQAEQVLVESKKNLAINLQQIQESRKQMQRGQQIMDRAEASSMSVKY